MENSNQPDNKSPAKIVVMIIVTIWIILGIAAFIMSIVCFGRSGTTGQHVVGLLLAIFFGPIYFVFQPVVVRGFELVTLQSMHCEPRTVPLRHNHSPIF